MRLARSFAAGPSADIRTLATTTGPYVCQGLDRTASCQITFPTHSSSQCFYPERLPCSHGTERTPRRFQRNDIHWDARLRFPNWGRDRGRNGRRCFGCDGDPVISSVPRLGLSRDFYCRVSHNASADSGEEKGRIKQTSGRDASHVMLVNANGALLC